MFFFGKISIKILNFHDFCISIINKKFTFKYSNFHEFYFYILNFHFNYSYSIKTTPRATIDRVDVRSLVGIQEQISSNLLYLKNKLLVQDLNGKIMGVQNLINIIFSFSFFTYILFIYNIVVLCSYKDLSRNLLFPILPF